MLDRDDGTVDRDRKVDRDDSGRTADRDDSGRTAGRGVSEVIGFVLIFSLITLSVGAVYVVGFGGLQDARDAEQLTNVERAFDVLADNIDDIATNEAPSRSTEVRLYEADLTVGEPTRFTVTVDDGTTQTSYSVNSYPIVYEAQASPTTLRYVNGAVIRQDRNGERFVQEPSFVFSTGSDDAAVIPLIQTRAQGEQAIGGTGVVLVRATRVLAEPLGTHAASGINYDVEMTVETTERRAPLWEAVLNRELDAAYGVMPCSSSGGTVSCSPVTVDRVYVTTTRIDVSIDG